MLTRPETIFTDNPMPSTVRSLYSTIWLFDDEHPSESTCTFLVYCTAVYCDRSIISPIQVQYDEISFESGFQSKMTTLLGNFRSLNRVHRHVSGKRPERTKCVFEDEKKILSVYSNFGEVSNAARAWLVVPNLSEVKYPTSESHLVKNYTYISGSHHDVYLIQFSIYRSFESVFWPITRMVTLATWSS